jgi:hypothetical protein
MVCSTQFVHQSCIKSSTISKRTEPSLHLSLITEESHRVRPNRFLCLWYVRCKPCSSLALTLTLSKHTKMRFHTTHITYEFHRVRPKLFMMYWYVYGKLRTYLVSRFALFPNRSNNAPLDPCHLGVPSGASKTIYEPMVCLTQTEHLSCTDANTVST